MQHDRGRVSGPVRGASGVTYANPASTTSSGVRGSARNRANVLGVRLMPTLTLASGDRPRGRPGRLGVSVMSPIPVVDSLGGAILVDTGDRTKAGGAARLAEIVRCLAVASSRVFVGAHAQACQRQVGVALGGDEVGHRLSPCPAAQSAAGGPLMLASAKGCNRKMLASGNNLDLYVGRVG